MARILYFGRLSDVAGTNEVTIDLPADVRDTRRLRDWLGSSDPVLFENLRDPRVRVAVNRAIVLDPAPIGANDEIAFLSPVSGG